MDVYKGEYKYEILLLCGSQLTDESVICTNCGCLVQIATEKKNASSLKTVAKIFLILSCAACGVAFLSSLFCMFLGLNWLRYAAIISVIYLIPLAWAIPMTVHYWKAVKNNRPVDTAFKVCTLLFINTVSGILMLCDKD